MDHQSYSTGIVGKVRKSHSLKSKTDLVVLDQPESAGNVHWMVPRAVNTLFTGRTELLDQIQAAFRENSTSTPKTQRRFVITGLGGLGKSEVSLNAANLMREE
jgi:hypothetical protein